MLTERRVRDAQPDARTRILWDSQVKGLGLRVTPTGTKSYILNYRVAGRERRATLARASELSLKAARERAAQELAAIRAGKAHLLERSPTDWSGSSEITRRQGSKSGVSLRAR